MNLIPIPQHQEENERFISDPLCADNIFITLEFYKKKGYVKPWISYYAEENGQLVGCAAFKGAPQNNSVEITYGTFEVFRKQGIGTRILRN